MNQEHFSQDNTQYLWGAGTSAIEFLESYPEAVFESIIETTPTMNEFMGHKIVSPSDADLTGSRIIVASEFYDEIKKIALEYGAVEKNLIPAYEILVKDADATVVSYQKCGRTWLRLILGRVFQTIFELPDREILRITQSPMRFCRIAPEMPKVIFHHDDAAHRKVAGQLNQSKAWYRGNKIVFLCRDPRDVVVSNFYHMTFRAKTNRLEMDDFVRKYFRGIIEFFNLWINADLPEFLVIRYEDMRYNTHFEISKVLRFVAPSLQVQESTIDDAIEFCSLENMAQYERENRFGSAVLAKSSDDICASKVRKGQVGGFRADLSQELQSWCHLQMEGLDTRYGYV